MGMVCVIISGIPAAGKSFLAKYLSRDFNIPWMSKDSIKEILFDNIGFSSREEKIRLNITATEELLYFSSQLMECQKIFIIENNFEKNIKQNISKLLKKYKYKCVTVMLTGDYSTIYKRFLLRNKSIDRHKGHIVNDYYPSALSDSDYNNVSFSQFEHELRMREMDKFDFGDIRLTIDTTNISDLDWGAVADQIKNAINALILNKEEDS